MCHSFDIDGKKHLRAGHSIALARPRLVSVSIRRDSLTNRSLTGTFNIVAATYVVSYGLCCNAFKLLLISDSNSEKLVTSLILLTDF